MTEYVQSLNEVLLEQYIDELYEGIDLASFKEVFKKMGKELATDFKFISSFGVIVTLFFPMVETLMKTMRVQVDLNATNIVLATLGAIAVLIDGNSTKLKKVLIQLKDKQWDNIIHEIVKALSNIKEIFIFIAKQTGKVIKEFTGMLGYTLLLVPFLKALMDFANHNKITLSDFSSMAMAVGTGVAIIAGKNITEWLLAELSKNKKLKINA